MMHAKVVQKDDGGPLKPRTEIIESGSMVYLNNHAAVSAGEQVSLCCQNIC